MTPTITTRAGFSGGSVDMATPMRPAAVLPRPSRQSEPSRLSKKVTGGEADMTDHPQLRNEAPTLRQLALEMAKAAAIFACLYAMTVGLFLF